MSDPITNTLTLTRIGNFVGARVLELRSLIGLKADKTQVDAMPRFFEASDVNHMLALAARVGDFCRRADISAGYKLSALPATQLSNWTLYFAPTDATVTKQFPFQLNQNPVISHNRGRVPIAIMIIDSDGQQNLAGWRPLDANRIQIDFTEPVAGVCSLTFDTV
jgi:hypothetical protein